MRVPCLATAFLLLALSVPSIAAERDFWKQIDRLTDEQKLQAAVDLLDKRIGSARASGDEADWTHALLKDTELRVALGGYETAVAFLKDQPWPKGPLNHALANLYYAHALVTYSEAYAWEIGQRERTDAQKPAGKLTLKSWTRDEIFAEANRAYFDVFAQGKLLENTPVAAVGAEYLTPNTYPAGIRGTLKDAVTYLWVEVLADTAGWRADQSNQVWQLDFEALLRGAPRTDSVKLDDSEVHPLLRITALLDDLEAFHQKRGDIEGALEAELTRLRILHDHFSSDAQRSALERTLSERLTRDRELPWWSAGAAQLADFLEADSGSDNLVRALAIAEAGVSAHPDSVGGRRCRSTVAHLQAPAFSMASMRADAADRRAIEVTHKNLPELFFRAYSMNLVEQLRSWGKQPSGEWRDPDQALTDRDRVRELLRSGTPAARWHVALPPTLDLKEHRTFVTPPMNQEGAYLIVASSRADFAEGDLPVVAAELLISDLVLATRDDPTDRSLTVEAFSGRDGTPLWPTKVELYRFDWDHGPSLVETREVTFGGRVRFSRAHRSGQYFLVGNEGTSWAFQPSFFFPEADSPAREASTLVFTDRAIYRPQQKILWKVVAYAGTREKADWTLRKRASLTVRLRDPNSEIVETKEVKTDDFGSAAGEFLIPTGRLLGTWRIESSHGESAVQVEEYKRPTFEVKIDDPEKALRLNRPATLTGDARYYFGLPVTRGNAKWKVTRRSVYPEWDSAYWRVPTSNAAEMVGSGTSELGDDGKFQFAFTPAADEAEAKSGVTYLYEAEVDVTDEGGETRSANRDFHLGNVAVEARLQTDFGYFKAGEPSEIVATRSDLDGTARAGAGSYRILALAEPTSALLPADEPLPEPPGGQTMRTAGDRLKPRWTSDYTAARTLRGWADGRELSRGKIVHDATGIARVPWPALPAGAYRVRYETKDDFGATFETQAEFLVADHRTSVKLPAVLEVEQSSVRVGESAHVLIASGFAGQELIFEVSKSGKVVERRKLRAGTDGTLIELPIGEKDRGGFTVTLQLLRDHQWMALERSVFVPWDDKSLSLELSTFRDRLRPGTHETWRVTVKTPGGAPASAGAAELLAFMYDKSLDLFAPLSPPNPLDLWPNFALATPQLPTLGERAATAIWSGSLSLPDYSWPDVDSLGFTEGFGVGGMGVRGMGSGGAGLAFDRRAPTQKPMPKKQATTPSPSESNKLNKKDKLEDLAEEKKTVPAETPATVRSPEHGQTAPPLRTNFSETAFFLPQLLTGADGSVAIEFKVPDSVTRWSVWLNALTQDFKSGSLHAETETVKDLMVRPYLPRFLREGDKADLKIVVNNASNRDLAGTVAIDIFDPETNRSLLSEFGVSPTQAFSVKRGGGTDLTVPLTAPKRVGLVAVKVTATAGSESDGEQRLLPLLPSRMHLSQSRFVSLKDDDRRKMTFEDLAKSNDPSRENEQLTVTVDAQLFMGVLNALPYLVNIPYECNEQTLNRFLATGILSSLYANYPGVAAMAKQMSARGTQFETWSQVDPNRKMALEETPWVQESHGGDIKERDLAKVLDPRIANAQRNESLARLRKAQLDSGAFAWWPGGPPSPYMTLYIVHGFSKAAEFGVPVPKEIVNKAFGYLAAVKKEIWNERLSESVDWEFLTFLNYVCTNFPDDTWLNGALTPPERKEMLDYSFAHWKQHSPYLKGFLALTLKRMGRPKDAALVFDSVMDSAKTVKDEGTFWAPEDRAWLWYNDNVETQAFALRTLLELRPNDPRKDGLVLWLFLNKKLNHWKSTRATAEVLYSLAKALTADHSLGVREEAKIAVGGHTADLVFEPDKFAPKRQVTIPGSDVSARDATIEVEKQGKGFAFASATWQYSTDELPTEERGDFFNVSRRYFKRLAAGKETVLKPIADGTPVAVGDEIEVQLSLRTKHEAEYVHLRDPRGAGFEPVSQVSQFKWDLGIGFYEEVRDSGENFFFEQLPVGEYTFKYRVRANMAGTFRVGPATVQSMYAPEFNAFSTGAQLKVTGEKPL